MLQLQQTSRRKRTFRKKKKVKINRKNLMWLQQMDEYPSMHTSKWCCPTSSLPRVRSKIKYTPSKFKATTLSRDYHNVVQAIFLPFLNKAAELHLLTSFTKATSPPAASGDNKCFSWSASSISVDSWGTVVAKDSFPSSLQEKKYIYIYYKSQLQNSNTYMCVCACAREEMFKKWNRTHALVIFRQLFNGSYLKAFWKQTTA